jgi:hypothetical protein
MVDLAKKGGDIPGLVTDAKEKAERDARWVGEWSDDITVAIALKEWGKAVDLVEKGAYLPAAPVKCLISGFRTNQTLYHTASFHETSSAYKPAGFISSHLPGSSFGQEVHCCHTHLFIKSPESRGCCSQHLP